MEQQQVIDGNKLIAVFDGFTPYSDTKVLGWLCPPGRVNQRYNDTTGMYDEENYFLDHEIKYHSSWDWLMPAIKKFMDYLQNIERPSRNHCCKGDLLEVDLQCHLREIDIEKTFKSFVLCVKWYNTQTK